MSKTMKPTRSPVAEVVKYVASGFNSPSTLSKNGPSAFARTALFPASIVMENYIIIRTAFASRALAQISPSPPPAGHLWHRSQP